MKVLIIANGDFFSNYGGGQAYVRNEVDEMILQGRHIAVLSFREGVQEIESLVYKGIPLYQAPAHNTTLLQELITKIAPSLLHVHAQKAAMVSIARELRIPVVVTAHHGGILCPAGALLNDQDQLCACQASHHHCLRCVLHAVPGGDIAAGLLQHVPIPLYLKTGRLLQRWPAIPFITPMLTTAQVIASRQAAWQVIARWAHRVIAPSHAMGEAMLRNGLPASKMVVLPHGIPLTQAASPPSQRTTPHFCYVGRICHEKGLHVLLRAFSGLPEQCRLFIAGDSANRTEARYHQKLKRRYANDARIQWLGKCSPKQVQALLARTDVLVHPTICLEVFGLNIAEALSAGRPVIATRCGGAEMQITHGQNGWLVPPNDAAALQAAMEALCRHPAQVAQASLLAPRQVTSIGQHVADLYNHVFNQLPDIL
ncbi:Glycosyltransferase involved in cell wall bisynthesis [Chitinophaga costaii]|uniref:Glycosyltransferase involved in cell wall bisynthesis n=1 Tax=Chitinophaga costaii TaxID=1335309 RepID=A0A1C3ZAU2_9BACT|nr:glycosyltransferase family 4 protein [Chitinophaga costaii]PUZ30296.1 glycosyltransferase [Chitinophaga costaii]SCB79420.1 Glycosyltransferase involved in cell wall bisynthesis [Chitinophaga costaii]